MSGVSSAVIRGLVRAGWSDTGVPAVRHPGVGVEGWTSAVSASRGGDSDSLMKEGEGDYQHVGCVADRSGCLHEGGVALGPDLELEELGEHFHTGNCFRPMCLKVSDPAHWSR